MNITQAIILGIVQGLTELLPISSSAHLNLFPWLFRWGEMSPSFDVALHFSYPSIDIHKYTDILLL